MFNFPTFNYGLVPESPVSNNDTPENADRISSVGAFPAPERYGPDALAVWFATGFEGTVGGDDDPQDYVITIVGPQTRALLVDIGVEFDGGLEAQFLTPGTTSRSYELTLDAVGAISRSATIELKVGFLAATNIALDFAMSGADTTITEPLLQQVRDAALGRDGVVDISQFHAQRVQEHWDAIELFFSSLITGFYSGDTFSNLRARAMERLEQLNLAQAELAGSSFNVVRPSTDYLGARLTMLGEIVVTWFTPTAILMTDGVESSDIQVNESGAIGLIGDPGASGPLASTGAIGTSGGEALLRFSGAQTHLLGAETLTVPVSYGFGAETNAYVFPASEDGEPVQIGSPQDTAVRLDPEGNEMPDDGTGGGTMPPDGPPPPSNPVAVVAMNDLLVFSFALFPARLPGQVRVDELRDLIERVFLNSDATGLGAVVEFYSRPDASGSVFLDALDLLRSFADGTFPNLHPPVYQTLGQFAGDLVLSEIAAPWDALFGAGNSERLGFFGAIFGNDGWTGTAMSDTFFGLGGDDSLIGGAGNDTLHGGEGNDTLHGGEGNDIIYGGNGADLIRGEAGNDWITPGAGSDTVEGGDGVDMVSFVDAAQRVVVDLAAGTAISGADTNILRDIENVTGSIYGDLITGDEGNNLIRALGDYDWIVGSGGQDTIDGGNGRDTVAYSSASSGVWASLVSRSGNVGQANGDSYIGIENLTGSSHADRLTGDNDRNVLRGLAGDDFIFGNGGNDTIDGGAGRDFLSGGNGNDRITGGRGNDTIDGGFGWDTALYSGNRADYDVQSNADGSTSVFHSRGSRADGIDLLVNVEVLEFVDGRVFVSSLADDAISGGWLG